MIIIGIDNGLSGALVAISTITGLPPVSMLPMPTYKKQKGRRVCAKSVDEWLSELIGNQEHLILLETPLFAKSSAALSSMHDSFGSTRAILEVRKWRHQIVDPRVWQKEVMPNCPSGQTKPMAIVTANKLFPDTDWRATKRCTTPDSGLIDAALIAHYGRLLLTR